MGDSFGDMEKSGQDVRFKKYYLSKYSENFDKVFVFSYANENVSDLPKNIILVPNKWNMHRYLYALLLPLLNLSSLFSCNVFRAYHLSGTPPAIISRVLFAKPYVFNYAYDYQKFAQIENKKLQKYFFSFLETPAIFFSKKVFAANKSILAKIGKKAIYLPNGVDTEYFKPAKTKRKNKKPQILSVGRLEKQKNFENLIKALSNINVDLTIVGHGSFRKKLIRLAKKEKTNLKIIDTIPNNQMPKIYNDADLFILSSVAEGSPKTLLEAMACGLPCISTYVGGTKDITGEKNVLITTSDAKSIEQAVEKLIGNNKLKKILGESAREKIIKDYNLKVLIKTEIDQIRVANPNFY